MYRKLSSGLLAVIIIVSMSATPIYAEAAEQTQEELVTAYVTRLYRVCLGREPDQRGLETWTGALLSGSKSAAEVTHGFMFSNEMRSKELHNDAFIETLYHALFDRPSDAKGKAHWTDALKRGWEKTHVYAGFVHSAAFEALCSSYGIPRGDWPQIPGKTYYDSSNKRYEMYCADCGGGPYVAATPEELVRIFNNQHKGTYGACDTALFNKYLEEVIRLTNMERVKAGVHELKTDIPILFTVADVRAKESEKHFDAQHTRPDGSPQITVITEFVKTREEGIVRVGENATWIGYGDHPNNKPPKVYYIHSDNHSKMMEYAKKAINGFMNSPAHKRTMLSEEYTHFAMGISMDDYGGMYYVQTFAAIPIE